MLASFILKVPQSLSSSWFGNLFLCLSKVCRNNNNRGYRPAVTPVRPKKYHHNFEQLSEPFAYLETYIYTNLRQHYRNCSRIRNSGRGVSSCRTEPSFLYGTLWDQIVLRVEQAVQRADTLECRMQVAFCPGNRQQSRSRRRRFTETKCDTISGYVCNSLLSLAAPCLAIPLICSSFCCYSNGQLQESKQLVEGA